MEAGPGREPVEEAGATPRQRSALIRWASQKWETLFFLAAWGLLASQVFFFYFDLQSLSNLHGAIAVFAAFESFVANRLSPITGPAILLILGYHLFSCSTRRWTRPCFDVLGAYLSFRMAIQLIGLNILVFDEVTPRFLLITQLLFFLPYSLLVWGWLYWRLDTGARQRKGQLFRLDYDREAPRPIDYFVASFSSVFSASISGIKGHSVRARILILVHGFVIYDVMGLTLSRAVALVQAR